MLYGHFTCLCIIISTRTIYMQCNSKHTCVSCFVLLRRNCRVFYIITIISFTASIIMITKSVSAVQCDACAQHGMCGGRGSVFGSSRARCCRGLGPRRINSTFDQDILVAGWHTRFTPVQTILLLQPLTHIVGYTSCNHRRDFSASEFDHACISHTPHGVR